MSICMGEEKALLGVKDIGILVGTIDEDAWIGKIFCMKGFYPVEDRFILSLGNKSDSKSAFLPIGFCLLLQLL